ncbi:PSME3-interacting protein-like [Convolutriloba macropyga]|uniref:PSME3-interacting protein-like n=1 Tax=Convolutriloba macropyga TaxID=536237 RepID=UPI003F527C6E
MASGAIRFENESSIEERKRARQEEWERVRTESDPIQAPEQEICNKTLYEQLQENKDKRDLEYEESRKFKNHFRGLEEDETTFLAEVEVQSRVHRSDLDSELKSLIEENKNIVLENLLEPTSDKIESFTTGKPALKKNAETKGSKSGLACLVKKRDAKPDSKCKPRTAKCPKIEDFNNSANSSDSHLLQQTSISNRSEISERQILRSDRLNLNKTKTETSDSSSLVSNVINSDQTTPKVSALSSLASYNDSDSDISDSD